MHSDEYRAKQDEAIDAMIASMTAGRATSTVVSMREDYEADEAMCATVLSRPDENVQSVCDEIVREFAEADDRQYFLPKSNRHITLRNVRTCDSDMGILTSDQADATEQALESVFARTPSLPVRFSRVVTLSTSLAFIGYPDPSYEELFDSIGEALEKAGTPDDKSYASGDIHWLSMTLCRFQRNPNEAFLAAAKRAERAHDVAMTIDSASFVRCNAVCSPDSLEEVRSYSFGA